MRTSRLLVSAMAVALLTTGCTAAHTPSVVFTRMTELVKAIDTGRNEAETARMSYTGFEGGDKIRGHGAYDVTGERTARAVTMTTPVGETVEMRLIDAVFYTRGEREVEPGKPWIKVDLIDEPMTGAVSEMIGQMNRIDLWETLHEFMAVSDLAGSGPEVIDGVPVTRYEIVVDLAKLAELVGIPPEPGGKIVYTVFLDAGNLPHRFVIDKSMPDGFTVGVTVDYTDWGKPVAIEAPAAAQIAELPES